MVKKPAANVKDKPEANAPAGKSSALVDTRVIHCGGLKAPFPSFADGEIGSFNPKSDDALTEIDHFFRHSGKVIVRDILDEQIARKLA